MPNCLIGLGSNVGDRASLIHAAVGCLAELAELEVVSCSSLHETVPVGGPSGQGTFLNAALVATTGRPPERLLDALHQIEKELGRRRVERWGPRSIDLDLLLYDEVVLDSGGVVVPHPRMAWRRFVLEPAVEVAPAMLHPTVGWTIRQLADHLNRSRPYVAIGGLPGSGRRRLARALAERCGGVVIADPVSAAEERGGGGNSSGGRTEVELEFANRRAMAVAGGAAVWDEPRPVWVSDFWLGQTEFEPPERACVPRLAVMLDVPVAACAERLARESLPPLTESERESWEVIRRAMLERIKRPGLGPVLKLDGLRPADALEELAAAVAAMR